LLETLVLTARIAAEHDVVEHVLRDEAHPIAQRPGTVAADAIDAVPLA
jgi:hypothetical protein